MRKASKLDVEAIGIVGNPARTKPFDPCLKDSGIRAVGERQGVLKDALGWILGHRALGAVLLLRSFYFLFRVFEKRRLKALFFNAAPIA
jgi:hypothetical protein